MTDWQIEPLGPWTKPVTKNRFSRYRFKASWDDTVALLLAETQHLGCRSAIAVRIDVQSGDIRRDGMLFARARVGFPGVIVSFQSRFGPLSYATDAYELWQHNVRAITLSLEALRAVDRYGVSKSGEQYTGWRAIENNTSAEFDSREDALKFLRILVADVDGLLPLPQLLRHATLAAHPDRHTGDRAVWDRVDQARRLLNGSDRD